MVQKELEKINESEKAQALRESVYFEYMMNCKNPSEMPDRLSQIINVGLNVKNNLTDFYLVYANICLFVQAYNASVQQDNENIL